MADYPPISDYALIGDCRTAALISREGSLDWLCLPNFDGPSLFAAILDSVKGGRFHIAPTAAFTSTRRYVGGTAVLETTFETASGSAALTDFMPALEESEKRHILSPLRQVIRVVRGVRGTVPMRLLLEARPQYAAQVGRPRLVGPSMVRLEMSNRVVYVRATGPLRVEGPLVRADWVAREGESCSVSMTYAEEAPAVLPWVGERAEEALARTIRYWTRWVSHVQYDGPYRDEVVRSALVLKLLSFAPSGAIVASPTTSLPERTGGVRNWDYRFCWVRDAALTVSVLLSLGLTEEAGAFVGWLLHAAATTRPRLNVLYSLFGLPPTPETTLDHLEGYRGSRPVRIGNAAVRQVQMDLYGELVDALWSYGKAVGETSGDLRRLVREIADYAAGHWTDPDQGIWEPRSGPREHVYSRVLCWVALERALRLPGAKWPERVKDRWVDTLKAIEGDVRDRGFNPKINAYPQSLGADVLDAATLLMPVLGFVSATDPRMVATVVAVRKHLTRDGLVYRYLGVDDGLPPDEGAFLACTFWLSAALALQGNVAEARATFERALRCANDLGLLAEEADPGTSAALGNFPQAFSHVGLVLAALHIARAEGYGT